MADLLQIGASGVLGHQRMLNTTGNNISNVNTDGFSRQRIENRTQLDDSGLAKGDTQRQVNKFAQAEVLIDTSAFNNRDKFLSEITRTDLVLSDESNNLGAGVTKLFESFHTTNDDPTSFSNRQLAVTDAETLVSSFHNVGAQLNQQMKTANAEISEKPQQLNSLINKIHEFNKQIVIAANTSKGVSGGLLDQRDLAIRNLAEEIDISTIVNDNNSISINLLSGQPLVMQSSVSHFQAISNNPVSTETELRLNIDNNHISLQDAKLGGKVGALFEFRDEALMPAIREAGQLSLGIGDAINSQNRMGIDLNGEMGKDIYRLPPTTGFGFRENSNPEHIVTSSVIPGMGSSLTTSEYQVVMTGANTFDVYEIKDQEMSTTPLTVNGTYPGPVEIAEHGIALDFTAAVGGFQSGDKFLLRPTQFQTSEYTMLTSRPEDLALASMLRTGSAKGNVSDTNLVVSAMTDPSLSFANNALNLSAPQEVRVNNSGDYDIYDGNGIKLATTPAAKHGLDLLANSVPPLNPGTGFEVRLDSQPNAGDVFYMSYNDNAIADNSNGLLLANLENEDMLRKNRKNNGENLMTFSEGVSQLISGVGNKTSAARVDRAATEAKLTQSEDWVARISGVNLDEEAANMVRYEQAYNAAAQVVNVSKEIFDTILNSAR